MSDEKKPGGFMAASGSLSSDTPAEQVVAEMRGEDAETLRAENARLTQELAAAREQLETAQNLPFAHSDPRECPCWYDMCQCNVFTLRFNIDRADKAEAEEEQAKGALAASVRREAELREALEQERATNESWRRGTDAAFQATGIEGDGLLADFIRTLRERAAPDSAYRAFFDKVFAHFLGAGYHSTEMDGGQFQDWAFELGLLKQVAYDPVIHGEIDDAEMGDMVYVLAKPEDAHG